MINAKKKSSLSEISSSEGGEPGQDGEEEKVKCVMHVNFDHKFSSKLIY